MDMDIVTAVMETSELAYKCQRSWIDTLKPSSDPKIKHLWTISNQVDNSVIGKYQKGLECSQTDIICFFHSDLEILEKNWNVRVMKEFENPKVGLIGFGGALKHGRNDIYKTPYDYRQLGRFDYMSNTEDAEIHGKKFSGSKEVATLDGFALIFRRELLLHCHGWPVNYLPPHHCYDYWATCMCHRFGYSVRMLGIHCRHHGGLTSTTSEYQEWCKTTKWGSDEAMHKAGHRLIYDEFRDVLPWVCD